MKEIENSLLEFSMDYAVKVVSCHYDGHYKVGLKSLVGDNYLWIIEQKFPGCYVICYKFDNERSQQVCFNVKSGENSLKYQLKKALVKAGEYFDMIESLNNLVCKEKDILFSEFGECFVRKDSGEYEDYL